MGTILTTTIIQEVSDWLLDLRETRRWSDAFHLVSLKNGQRDIVIKRPAANPIVEALELEPGVRQQIPVGRTQLIELRYNLAADGETPTRIIRHKTKEELDHSYPAWPSADPAVEVQFFMFDPRYPRFFDVFPPQPSTGPTGIVEMVCGDTPPDPELDEAITIGDQFAEALKFYMLARARATDGSGTMNWEKAKGFMELYRQELGLSKQAERDNEPTPEPPGQ